MNLLPRHCLFTCVFLLGVLSVVSAVAEQYQYREQKGKEVAEVTVNRTSEGGFIRTEISGKGVTAVSFNEIGNLGATRRWQYDAGAAAQYSASRDRNIVTITGKEERKPYENGAGLDDNPWFQDLGLSLGRFSKTPFPDLVFWTIKEGEAEPTLLKAKKRGAETVSINGQSVATQKIEIGSDDFFLKLWTAFYWFRDSDGLLVKYQSDPGIPGMSATVGTLVSGPTP